MPKIYIGKISQASDPKNLVAAVSGGSGGPVIVMGEHIKGIVVLDEWEYDTKDGTIYPKKLPALFLSTFKGKISEGASLVLSDSKMSWSLEGDKHQGYLFRPAADTAYAWVTGKPTRQPHVDFMALSKDKKGERFFVSNSIDIDSLMPLTGLIVVKPLPKPARIIPQVTLLPTKVTPLPPSPLPLETAWQNWEIIALGVGGILGLLLLLRLVA